jgi:NMD protein affecting ribosome stability and mRNA decay
VADSADRRCIECGENWPPKNSNVCTECLEEILTDTEIEIHIPNYSQSFATSEIYKRR